MFWPWRTEADPQLATPDRPHPGRYLNLQQWDGYQWERDQILLTVESQAVENVMVISGDDHVFSAAELSPDWDDCDRPPVLVEFNGASISSSNADELGLPETPDHPPAAPGGQPLPPLLRRRAPRLRRRRAGRRRRGCPVPLAPDQGPARLGD